MTEATIKPIPWNFTDSPGVLMWTWLTEHFIARITGAETGEGEGRTIRSYSWELSDRMRMSQEMPRLLIGGQAAHYQDADLLIREHVGKCYDPRLGYQGFAGALVNTFTLASGDTVDVTSLIGTRCTVTVLLSDNSREIVMGDMSVDHYKWRLRDGEQILEVTPEHVLAIVNRSVAAQRAAALVEPGDYSGIARIYRGDRTNGCTGTPGYVLGTVDHAGAGACPIHEGSIREDLLR